MYLLQKVWDCGYDGSGNIPICVSTSKVTLDNLIVKILEEFQLKMKKYNDIIQEFEIQFRHLRERPCVRTIQEKELFELVILELNASFKTLTQLGIADYLYEPKEDSFEVIDINVIEV